MKKSLSALCAFVSAALLMPLTNVVNAVTVTATPAEFSYDFEYNVDATPIIIGVVVCCLLIIGAIVGLILLLKKNNKKAGTPAKVAPKQGKKS